MFPHMYKVRPGKVQQVKEPGMAADCQRQRGENWRRNSGGGSSFQQNPPAIPAPPTDPQDNLTRKPSLPSKEPERKGSKDQIQFIENDSSIRGSSPSPVLSRTRMRSRGQPGQIVTMENGESESSDHLRMRTRSRSRISEDKSANENYPSSVSDTSSELNTRVRSRSRQEEAKPVPSENTFPPPGRLRSRSRPSEELQSNARNSVEQESATFSPRSRTRSRSRVNEANQSDNSNTISDSVQNNDNSQPIYGRMRSRSRPSEDIQKDINVTENSYPAPFRTRSRSRTNMEENEHKPIERVQSPPTVEQNMSLPPPGRRQREQETERVKNDPGIEISETIPFRSRQRTRNIQNEEPPSNNIVSEAQFVRERSRSRKNDDVDITGEKIEETPEPDNQVVSPPVQTVTIRLRKRPKKQESEESLKIPEGIADSNEPSQLEKQINSQETVNTENKIDETPSVVIRRRVRPPKPEAVDDENKQEETAAVTIRRRVREPKMEEPTKEDCKPEETATVTIPRRSRTSKPEEILVKEKPEEERGEKAPQKDKTEEEKSFSQENETTEIQTTQNDQPKHEENKKPLTRDVFFPETMKSEIVVRKRSSSPAPTSLKKDVSPLARKRSDQNEEIMRSSPVPSTLKNDASPLSRRRRSDQNEDHQRSSPVPPILKNDASPLARRRSDQNEDHTRSESPVSIKTCNESPQSTRRRNQSPLERTNEKSVLPATKNDSSLEENIMETATESMENKATEVKPEVVPIKLKVNEIIKKENFEPSKESLKSADDSHNDGELSRKNKQISPNLQKEEIRRKTDELNEEKIIKEDKQESELPKMQEKKIENKSLKETEDKVVEIRKNSEEEFSELLKGITPEDQNKKNIENKQINYENQSNETVNEKLENQMNSDLSLNIINTERNEPTEDLELPSNILKIDIKEDDWEKKVISEKAKKSEEDSHKLNEFKASEPEDQITLTPELATDSFKDKLNNTEGKASEREISQNLSGLSDVDIHDKKELVDLELKKETPEMEDSKQEESHNLEESEEEEEEEDEEKEDEDPLAKATRLWLLSKNQNSEILGKVLPEIESSSGTKERKCDEKEIELLHPDDDINKENEVKPQMIEEWNDDFKEEPKNFTSFTSIKLKSRPPKSPPDKKKSGRVLSKDESSNKPTAPAPPPPPPPPPPGPKSKSGIPKPPPPPPPSAPLSEKDLKVKKAREKMVDRIKKAARSRPDWKSVMKDIEGGAKLRKVSSSDKLDRSNPILPKSRGKGGKFFYESEKPVVQNQLLGEIQRGVKLRHVKTNDRSKPDFAKLGLRKLRRQLTVEEKKSISSNTPEALPSSSDEEEDIDQMRDDLASTKTQLAEEIKKNKKLETEQKILQIDLQSLQAEVKKLKRKLKEAGIHEAKPLTNGEAEALAPKLSKSMSKLRMMEEDLDFSELDTIEKDIQLLNDQIEAQKKRAEKAELKCDELNQKLQVSQTSCDEWEMRSVYFEKKYKTLQKDQGIELPEIDCSGTQTDPIEIGPAKSDSSTGLYTKKSGSRKSFASVSRMQSFKEEDESDEESSSSSEEDTLSDHQGDEDEDEERESGEEDEDDLRGSCADLEKREEREFIMWKNRLTHMKDKVKNVRKERNNLRERVKKYFVDMRLERKEYLKLKAELKDLLDQMKDDEDVIEEEDEEEESEEEEEEVAQEEEAPEWWCDETPQKPKKLKKRKQKEKENEDEDENIVDMSGLEDPQWSESEQEESESEEEDENTANRIKSLKERTKSLEENMNAKRKETYQLKSKIDQCEEMIAEEKRRHARLENELHMLLADI